MKEKLENKEIADKIKTSYINTFNSQIKKNKSLFGYSKDSLRINISINKEIPGNGPIYSCEEFQCYKVNNFEDVVDIFKILELYEDGFESFIRSEVFNVYNDFTPKNGFYLRVACC